MLELIRRDKTDRGGKSNPNSVTIVKCYPDEYPLLECEAEQNADDILTHALNRASQNINSRLRFYFHFGQLAKADEEKIEREAAKIADDHIRKHG